ncbi:MAG: hypothetical protein ABJL99_19965 [Aliishimia sp.]
MIRTAVLFSIIGLLSACSDGRGSQYSSARAAVPAPTYIPVTPGATPVDVAPAGAIPVAIAPAGTPVPTASVVTAAPLPVATAPVKSTVATVPPEAVVTQASVALPRTPAAPEPIVRFATGPIFSACQKAGRKAASRARCGCVQWVADKELNASDQRRGATYFSNQHQLQEVRQSQDRNSSNERFWAAWKAYGQVATQQCKGT